LSKIWTDQKLLLDKCLVTCAGVQRNKDILLVGIQIPGESWPKKAILLSWHWRDTSEQTSKVQGLTLRSKSLQHTVETLAHTARIWYCWKLMFRLFSRPKLRSPRSSISCL